MASGGLGAATMAPWFVRNEARNVTGALHSPVPGRTDHLPIHVPAGSYVVPADIISGIGQGNTTSGLSVMNKMFFQSGPLGMAPMKGGGGRGAPKAPKALTKFASGGLAGDSDTLPSPGDSEMGTPDAEPQQQNDENVPIMAAGGEFIIPPERVREIGGGDIDVGHEVLDYFVTHMRDDLIKTLQKLPGPAKD